MMKKRNIFNARAKDRVYLDIHISDKALQALEGSIRISFDYEKYIVFCLNLLLFIAKYSKVPIIRTGMYASSAVHIMYCQNCPMFGTYNRSFRVLYYDNSIKLFFLCFYLLFRPLFRGFLKLRQN